MSKIQVIDNFLPQEIFEQFAYQIISSRCYRMLPYTTNPIEATNNNFTEIQAQALLYARNTDGIQSSDIYEINYPAIQALKESLKIKKLWLMRSICIIGQNKSYQGVYHTDFPKTNITNPKIAILYLNSNNGGTHFKDEGFVKSEANRCVIADGYKEHAGVWQTDEKLRFVLNINYEEHEKESN